MAPDRKPAAPMRASVALGCIMRGETYHFEVVSNESARGLMSGRARSPALPVGNGILTVENDEQAMVPGRTERSGNKGGEAAQRHAGALAREVAAPEPKR